MSETVEQVLREALDDAERSAKWQREQQQQWREKSDGHRDKAIHAERQVVELRAALAEQPEQSNDEIATEDVRAIAVALGLGDHARPYSAHAVVHREVLPAIAALREIAAS